jgi:hypothetical protein
MARTQITKTCPACGKEFQHTSQQPKRKFCSPQCLGASRTIRFKGKTRGRPSWQEQIAIFLARFSDNSQCWEWSGSWASTGYGRLNPKRGFTVSAHRGAWEVVNGPIPNGLFVLHHCDNPPCCNPSHLFLGTPKDNTQDMLTKGRNPHGEQHYRARLTAPQVVAIRADARSHRSIAADYSIARVTVTAIKNGRMWRHLL